MKIFEFDNQPNQAYLYTPHESIGQQCIAEDPPRSLAVGWSIPTFELVGCDEFRSYLPKKDFVAYAIGTAVLSQRAVERLRPILAPCGGILPIRLSNDRDMLYLLNVIRIINAVDMTHSKFFEFFKRVSRMVRKTGIRPATDSCGRAVF